MISRPLQIAIVILLFAVFGMGMYVLETKRRAELSEMRAQDQRPIAPPVAGSQENVTIWVARDADGSLHSERIQAALPDDRPERERALLRALLGKYETAGSLHPIGAGADIKAIYLLPDGLAVLDMNAAFADRHPSGVLVETLTLASIAETLERNSPAVKRLKFLVEGKDRATLAGHADLSGTYDLGVLAQTVPKQ
jgi:spore germination protein GerM